MRNIKLTVEYDGTNYKGWQIQPNAPSVQGEIEKALLCLTQENCAVNGSGRTDAGVHARGQIANFKTESRIPAEKFAYAINSMLPRDIVIKNAEAVDLDFHARFSAIGKEYSYHIINSRFRSALLQNYAWHVNYCEKLEIQLMKEAAEFFIGDHDFISFMATGGKVKSTIRRIDSIAIETKDEQICLSYRGNGFLYNMVRIMTGTLIYVGIGKIQPKEISDILLSRNRDLAGITAPACGLYLEKVFY